MREQKIMRLRLRFCYMQKSNEKKPILFFITFFLHQNNTFYSKKLKYKECMEIVILVLVQFREFFPALWQLEILIRISRTFWNIGLKKFPHFLTFGILQYEFPAFFFIWCILSFPHFFQMSKTAGKFKLLEHWSKYHISYIFCTLVHFITFATFFKEIHWRKMGERIKNKQSTCTLWCIFKYNFDLDSYFSINKNHSFSLLINMRCGGGFYNNDDDVT